MQTVDRGSLEDGTTPARTVGWSHTEQTRVMPAQAKPCPGPQPCSHSARGPRAAGQSGSARPETEGQSATAPFVLSCGGADAPLSAALAGPHTFKATFFRETRASPPTPMQGGDHAVTSGLRQGKAEWGTQPGQRSGLGCSFHLFVIKMKKQGSAGGRTERCSTSLAVSETQTPAPVRRRFRPFRAAGIKK